MPILSPEFPLFFLLFLLVYWSFQSMPRAQNVILLAANIGLLYYLNIFFAVSVIVFSLVMTFIGRCIQAKKQANERKLWLVVGVAFSMLILGFFKYFDYFRPMLHDLGYDNVTDILMPLGLSYYVFQSIAYISGIYRGISPALKWHELLLHFSFFLTITAGPIIRADRFRSIDGNNLGATEQIRRPRKMLHPALAIGLILLGTAKVWWFSGNIAIDYVNPVFDNPMQYGTPTILLAVYGYTLQLFFDFSGYSDLVIGMAMLLGFRLPWNFRAPLYSVNIRDFWARWHITLSTWVRDYIYIPLGGSRHSFWRTQLNLLVAFVLSGIWHGNTFNFFIWGMLHGLALVFLNVKYQFWHPLKARFISVYADDTKAPKLYWWQETKRYLSIFTTFNFVCFTFVFFRIESFDESRDFFNALFQTSADSVYSDWLLVLFIFISIACYPLWIRFFQGLVAHLRELPLVMWIVLIILILQLIIICAPSGIPGFIYADF